MCLISTSKKCLVDYIQSITADSWTNLVFSSTNQTTSSLFTKCAKCHQRFCMYKSIFFVFIVYFLVFICSYFIYSNVTKFVTSSETKLVFFSLHFINRLFCWILNVSTVFMLFYNANSYDCDKRKRVKFIFMIFLCFLF